MNPLAVNPASGFLESPSNQSLFTFSSEKKQALLSQAKAYRQEYGKWPNFDKLCESLGVNPRTLERHLKLDEKFAGEFRDMLLGAKWQLESQMYDLSSKNPMYMLIWLRKHFPEEYNPEYKHSVQIDVNVVNADRERIGPFIEGEVVLPSEKR